MNTLNYFYRLHESFPQISSSLQAAAAAAVVSPTIKIDFFEVRPLRNTVIANIHAFSSWVVLCSIHLHALLLQTATEYHLEAELPGVEQENISLSYDDETRVLTIKAAKETYFSNDQDTKNKAATGKGNGKKVKKATAIETPTAAAAAEPPAVNISALNELYQLETNALTKAEKKALRRQRKKAMKESGVSGNTLYHRVERSYGVSTRSMTMPEDAELENMRAWYKDGLLVISMPRNEGLSKSKEYLSHIKKVPIEA